MISRARGISFGNAEMLSKVAAAAARLPSLRRRIDNWYRARYIRKVTNCQSENLAFLLGIPAIIVRIRITIFSSKIILDPNFYHRL